MAKQNSTLGNAAIPSDLPFADQDDAANRPVWENTPDETDVDRRPRPLFHRISDAADADADLLLAMLADAADALARLDARVAASDDAVRTGLRARPPGADRGRRLARPHPFLGAPARPCPARGGPHRPGGARRARRRCPRAAPYYRPANRPPGWEDPPLDTVPAVDQAVADALAFARLLRRPPGGGPHPSPRLSPTP